MINQLKKYFALAVQLLLLACALVSPVNAKTALGPSGLDYQVALGSAVSKSLTVLDNFLAYKVRALGCCVGADSDLPNTNNPSANTTTVANSNNLPTNYRHNTDGSITGPSGGRAWDTGYSDINGNPVYQRNSGGYYTLGTNGQQIKAGSPKPHGNTIDNTPTEIYQRISTLDGSYQKIGISTDSHKRYAADELGFDRIEVVGTRPRAQVVKVERFIAERWPGPLNKESWAGKRNPSHPNYDPNYIPFHLRKN